MSKEDERWSWRETRDRRAQIPDGWRKPKATPGAGDAGSFGLSFPARVA